jgi:hypothetical protein
MFFAPIGTLFNHFLGSAAVSKSKLSNAYKKSMVPFEADDRIKVDQPSYVVAGLADNKAVANEAVFASEGMARDYMNSLIEKDPNNAGEVHVIPMFEAVLN